MHFTEDMFEQAVIELFENMGYTHIYAPDMDRDYSSPLLDAVLMDSLVKLNKGLPLDAITEAVNKLRNFDTGSLLQKNIQFMDYLQNGIPVRYFVKGEERNSIVYLIDYKIVTNNSFYVVNQFTYIENGNNRRPDIILFVNGLPLVLMELKSPSKDEVNAENAYNQIRNYMKDIPSIFNYNAICVISDLTTNKAGTITSGLDRFMEWKTKDGSYENTAYAQFDTFYEGMFDKARLLDIIKNFICFSVEQAKAFKILAGYHQYFAVRKAVEKAIIATKTDGKGGVFWHTQGSGKSLSMVFYAHLLASELRSPTILVLTDRNDLDGQLYGQFLRCKKFLRQTAVLAESRVHLREFLAKQKQNGIFFSTIQKFEESDDALSDRRDLIVIADEAHRGHYGFAESEKVVRQKDGSLVTKRSVPTARIIHDSLPHATFIGFTGTPIDEGDRSTREVFGDYIDIYDMTQAVEDGATRPVYYESRVVKLNLNKEVLASIDREYERIAAEDEADEEVIAASKRDLSQMEALLGHDDTIESLVTDILGHYEGFRRDNLAGKAMIVAYSRPIAIKIYERFLAKRPAWKEDGVIQVVMTEGNQDPEPWRKIIGTKKDRIARAVEFKKVDSKFKIVIVVDMWLTGFDVPCLDTMYVYKPMVGHNLMQAIARVNRVYKDKEGGLVVDYIGIASALKNAMNQYTVRDRKRYGNPDVAKIAKPKFYEHLEVCRNQLHGYDFRKGVDGNDLERAKAIRGAVNFLLVPARKAQKDIFLDNAYLLKQAMSLCAVLLPERDRFEAGFMEAVRGILNQWKMSGEGGTKKGLAELNAQIAELVKQSVQSDGVINIFSDRKASVSLFDAAFLAEIGRMPEKNLAVEMLKRLLEETISAKTRVNLVKSEEFSTLLQKVMNEYLNAHISNEEVIKRLIELAQRIKEGLETTPKGLSEEEAAFYDALAKPEAVRKFYTDDTLVALTKELTEQLRRNRTVDWDKRDSARAHMRRLVKQLLRKYKYPPDESAEALQTVMRQCELWVDGTPFEESVT